ncbi:hypothetical protein Goshw_007086, partial [Gossypium schwendimanii]|nr:hypothetical protein [Gossypium schwendimanii]
MNLSGGNQSKVEMYFDLQVYSFQMAFTYGSWRKL